MKVFIASDHAGFNLKQKIKEFLNNQSQITELKDFGTDSEQSMDYPDVVHPLCKSIEDDPSKELGILICGSGNGVCITANKYIHIRAALCWTEELASLARQHNNANILCLPARFIEPDLALKIVTQFLNTPFEGGRHLNRVNKICGNLNQ